MEINKSRADGITGLLTKKGKNAEEVSRVSKILIDILLTETDSQQIKLKALANALAAVLCDSEENNRSTGSLMQQLRRTRRKAEDFYGYFWEAATNKIIIKTIRKE